MSISRPLRVHLVLALLASALSACDSKDAAKCDEAQRVTRQALGAGDANLTQQWRDYAYKHCADQAVLASLDKEIVEKQAAQKAKEAEEASRKQQNEGLLKVFMAWVGENRAAPERASVSPQCEGEPTATTAAAADNKPKERFCSATRTTGTHTLTVRYWDADKTAALFTVRPPGPISCQDLGPHRVVNAWDVPATNGTTAKRTRCELTSGPLAGMHAVVSAAMRADVYIFTPQYLERDPALKPILSGP